MIAASHHGVWLSSTTRVEDMKDVRLRAKKDAKAQRAGRPQAEEEVMVFQRLASVA